MNDYALFMLAFYNYMLNQSTHNYDKLKKAYEGTEFSVGEETRKTIRKLYNIAIDMSLPF